MVVPVRGRRLRVRAYGGPTWFRINQDAVSEIFYNHFYFVRLPTNGVEITNYDVRRISGTGWGFHGGADASVFFTRILGVGAFARYAHGTVEFENPLATTLGQRERAGVVQHELPVERRPREGPRVGAGRDDHVARRDRFPGRARDLDLPRAGAAPGKAAAAMVEGNLVLLEEVHDAVVVLPDHLVLALEHLGEIEGDALQPYAVVCERMRGVIAARAAAAGVGVEAMRDQYLNKISLRRMVSAEDVAATALFLCSPAARNLTGQAISVDGNLEYL